MDQSVREQTIQAQSMQEQSTKGQNELRRDTLGKITWVIGNACVLEKMQSAPALEPFALIVLNFLHALSRQLMDDQEVRKYPDVVTFAFWIRSGSTLKMKERFQKEDENIRLGRGVAFHIAPSNVAINFAYSLIVGLLTGNANVVRVPAKEFPQVDIVSRAIQDTLGREEYHCLEPYVCLVRYGREKEINDLLSAMADTRLIWGGDGTIADIRRSPLAPRAGEITFADRYSLAVIDSESYMNREDKERIAEDFYNDTFLTDQNACTSPRMIVWMGNDGKRREEAKEEFWGRLHSLVEKKYNFQAIQSVNKLFSSCLAAVRIDGVRVIPYEDNRIIRIWIPSIPDGLMDLKDNSGYFFEYDCEDILELRGLCNDTHCQTLAYIGDKEMLQPLLMSAVRGVDRVVPVGQTMNFDLIWDGYNLYERLTRVISIV